MGVRMNVPWDDGTVRLVAGEEYFGFSPTLERRLVRSGLAEEVGGNESLNQARAGAGMAPLKETKEDMKALRRRYRDVFGKQAFPRWSAAELRRRIALERGRF